MKYLTFLIASFIAGFVYVGSVLAYQSPGKPLGYVSDFAGVLSSDVVASLDNKIGNFARPAGVQMAVVTVPSLGGDTIENYAAALFKEWGIGQKIADNGILLLVAPNDREARIEVGYGLEPTVTDAMSSVVIRTIMIPAFKNGDYSGGINQAVDELMGLIEKDPQAVQSATPIKSHSTADVSGPFIVFLFVLGLNLLSIMARTKSWWLGGVIGLILGLVLVGSIVGVVICTAVGLIVDFLLSKYASKFPKDPRGGPGRGLGAVWFLGGGRGGGFGGFGGGGSGGGGASGKW